MLTTSHINPSRTELGEMFTQMEPDSVTVEEGDLLYALVRMRKPKLAVETGTGHAIATRRIGEALMENGFGKLLSCDTEPEYVAKAVRSLHRFPVDIRCTSGLNTLKSFDGLQAEFIFVDAGNADNRMEEIKLILHRDLLAPKGFLIVHDALDEKYKQLITYLRGHAWVGMIFESLAGIAIFQKP